MGGQSVTEPKVIHVLLQKGSVRLALTFERLEHRISMTMSVI